MINPETLEFTSGLFKTALTKLEQKQSIAGSFRSRRDNSIDLCKLALEGLAENDFLIVILLLDKLIDIFSRDGLKTDLLLAARLEFYESLDDQAKAELTTIRAEITNYRIHLSTLN